MLMQDREPRLRSCHDHGASKRRPVSITIFLRSAALRLPAAREALGSRLDRMAPSVACELGQPWSATSLKKVVLAYSGGLDTSVAVAWLREKYDVEVVTLTVDVGGGSLREGVATRAMSAGASRAYVVDAKDRFVRGFVWPSLQANALYQNAYPLATALARPLIAQLLVEVAAREDADAVAHGCTGKGNDQVRFDVAVHALDPGLEVVAPMRVGMGLTRDQSIDYANARGIELPITKSSPYSIDVNLWGRSCETGVLEDPWVTPPDDAYAWTVKPADAPEAVDIVIGFEGGIPVSLDGEQLGGLELVERLHELGGRHGVGR